MDSQYLQDEKITVLLADDHPIIRAGIRSILSSAPDIQIIGEAASGFDVQNMVGELLPKILLLDLQMPAQGHPNWSTGFGKIIRTSSH